MGLRRIRVVSDNVKKIRLRVIQTEKPEHIILQITEIVVCPEVVVTLLKGFPEHPLCLPAAAESLISDCLCIVGGIGYPVIGHTWEIDRLRSRSIYPDHRCGRRSQRTYDIRPRSHQGRHSCNRRNKPLCNRINEQIRWKSFFASGQNCGAPSIYIERAPFFSHTARVSGTCAFYKALLTSHLQDSSVADA